ncbi:MAG: hypothetical protein JXR46_03495 [Calditrichaceae bacterium]|nr:hypothetical protein [Calditrichaceae bacterium]MBN2708088.1 hypothetical protein [Calditrichaceae bacterium]RQV95145.1 MAG: hypothetical protein EH224_08335 [Calditrichota bacterium]
MRTQNRSLNFSGQTFYIGLDIHKRKWVVTIRNNKTELKTYSMDLFPEQLKQSMSKHYPGGRYVSAYEAGYFGFWTHRKLTQLGFKNIVFNAADKPTSHKEKVVKTDPIMAQTYLEMRCENKPAEVILNKKPAKFSFNEASKMIKMPLPKNVPVELEISY